MAERSLPNLLSDSNCSCHPDSLTGEPIERYDSRCDSRKGFRYSVGNAVRFAGRSLSKLFGSEPYQIFRRNVPPI